MSQEEDVISRSETFKDKSEEASKYVSQDGSNQESVCRSCGARLERFSETCAECGAVIESRASTVTMVLCPMCDGTGTIFLKYLEGYALAEGNHDQRWLPCADCNGTGEIPRRVIIGREKKKLRKEFLEIFLTLLDGLTSR